MSKPVEVSFSYPLPVPTEGKTLAVSHFPTAHQTLIFRLWEMVDYRKIAKVLKTSGENVLRAAGAMGMGPQNVLETWMTRGYIAIIKAVWNLLPYEQILELLDWDEDHLAYILQEDDFLGCKLGEKCFCPPVFYRELTREEQERTAAIRQTMLRSVRPLDSEETARPFDFYRSTYAPIVEKKVREVVVDNSWCVELPADSSEIDVFVADFKAYAKKYGVAFTEKSEKKIRIVMDVQTDDEEYREVSIRDNEILIRAAYPVGVLRGLYDLEDLAESVGTFSFEKKTYRKKTKVKTRIIYSFSSLYTGVLEKDTALSFPDELLEGYGRRGINGIWIQAVLYQMAPYPFAENLCQGWENRLANLEALTRRAARYGIKVYLYINEPRNMPASFFENYPHLKGATLQEGWHCLCSSHPDTHKYMKDALQTLCTRVPLLGGFLNITQSENRVLCCSQGIHTAPEQLCPVCSQRKNSEVNAEMIRVMCDAIAEVAPQMKFFAWAWAWVQHLGKEDTDALVRSLPKNAIVMQVSESQIQFERGGIHSFVRDYSISIVGPGDPAREMWKTAREQGLEVAAKVQINNSWECSSVPYLPVYENVAQHMKNLIDEGVEHMLLSWTLGGYMSDNIKIASSYFFEEESERIDAYQQVLERNYGPYAGQVKEAVGHFCRGFDQFPFNVWHIYRSTCNSGAANLLYPQPSGMECTMTCFPYDDLEGWRGARPGDLREGAAYPPEVLEDQYRKLCQEWEKGLKILEGMPQCEFYDMALYGYTLFKSTHNHISYVRQRDGERNEAVMRRIVENEREMALLAYRIMLRNSAVGFEAANHYFATRSNLVEKIVQCDYLLQNP